MCDQPAKWLVDITGTGDRRLCDECIRYRHCGKSFSLLQRTAGICECRHMPARIEQDRAASGDAGERRGAA